MRAPSHLVCCALSYLSTISAPHMTHRDRLQIISAIQLIADGVMKWMMNLPETASASLPPASFVINRTAPRNETSELHKNR